MTTQRCMGGEVEGFSASPSPPWSTGRGPGPAHPRRRAGPIRFFPVVRIRTSRARSRSGRRCSARTSWGPARPRPGSRAQQVGEGPGVHAVVFQLASPIPGSPQGYSASALEPQVYRAARRSTPCHQAASKTTGCPAGGQSALFAATGGRWRYISVCRTSFPLRMPEHRPGCGCDARPFRRRHGSGPPS